MSVLLCMTSCHWFCPEEEEVHYDRTVLVYMAAENSLSGKDPNSGKSYHELDIDEMVWSAVGLNSKNRLLVYLDDTEEPRILAIERQQGRRPTCKVVKQYADEHDSGDASTLRLVMEWMYENSPSESYGLVFWSHGDGWLPGSQPKRSICIDNGKNSSYSDSGTKMDIKSLSSVLAAFPKLDFIMFDACFMQSVEVAYELRQVARYIVASPAEIPMPGAPYQYLLQPMFASVYDVDVEGIIRAYCGYYEENFIAVSSSGDERHGALLSVVDSEYLDDLAVVTAEMLAKYLPQGGEVDMRGVQQYCPYPNKSRPEYYDMNGCMRRLITDDSDYDVWRMVFDRAVPYANATVSWYSGYSWKMEEVDIDNYGGISCYVPKRSSTYSYLNAEFQKTSWHEAAGWARVGW